VIIGIHHTFSSLTNHVKENPRMAEQPQTQIAPVAEQQPEGEPVNVQQVKNSWEFRGIIVKLYN
jgi:hypothetical protein